MKLGFPVIDLHTHLRSDIPYHTKIAKQSGIDVVCYMANCKPPLDNIRTIKQSLRKKRYCQAIPISAITKDLAGKELVDVLAIKPFVVGFSDDGKYLEDLKLVKEILNMNVLVLAHCSPSYKEGPANPTLETKFIKKYLKVLAKTKGRLHIQHVSKKGSVESIKTAKKQKLRVTCETAPHYFTFTKDDLETRVNPPLAEKEDVVAIKKGLSDGTIDVIASDYAPTPRKTGIAGFRSFFPLSYGLVLERVLTIKQLKEKLFINPKNIIESSGYKLDLKNPQK